LETVPGNRAWRRQAVARLRPMHPPLRLPRILEAAIWKHAEQTLPRESVGVIGARRREAEEEGADSLLRAIYPLSNIAPQPQTQYLADPLELLRALRAMQQSGLVLAAIYHSHPNGPARPSLTDLRLAEYSVPYIIADVPGRELRAYLLPENIEVEIELDQSLHGS
jgi:proteasome lid subunit RPN8/RPN11